MRSHRKRLERLEASTGAAEVEQVRIFEVRPGEPEPVLPPRPPGSRGVRAIVVHLPEEES